MKDSAQQESRREDGRLRVRTINEEPSLAQQQFKEECDINNIVKKFHNTGEFLNMTSKTGVYADFSEIQDYQTMLHTVMAAEDAFNALPAQVRAKFRNDPGQLITYLQDPKNEEEARSLGLLNPKAEIQTTNLNDDKKQAKKSAKPLPPDESPE